MLVCLQAWKEAVSWHSTPQLCSIASPTGLSTCSAMHAPVPLLMGLHCGCRESEQTGHSFVEKFPEYFSDMPNPKDCNNGRIGEPCDDRFPCGSNTGGTLALYALEASTLALRCTRCEPLRRVSLTDCVHQDNQYWAENSAYNEGDRTWHTTLAAQTLEAPKRCKVC